MNTFELQYARLSPKAQQHFVQQWGVAPWNNPSKNQPQQRKAWKAALDPQPHHTRWEYNIHPNSPLWMALRAKNRRAANAILDKTETLTRKEAANCAPLTLQWAPDLLERILDKTPGRPFAWMIHIIALEDGFLNLYGSLVMIAAALNDLRALELLLQRGGQPNYHFRRDRWEIVGDLLMGGITMGALSSPDYSVSRLSSSSGDRNLRRADPLAAAIFCNAKRCALRLLEEPSVTITPAVRRALALTPIRETQRAVAERLNVPLEALLLPEDFGLDLNHPLLPTVLRQHGGVMPRETLKDMVLLYPDTIDEDIRQQNLPIFSLIEPALLGEVVLDAWQGNRQQTRLLEIARSLSLPAHRCRVREQLSRPDLLRLLDSFTIVGAPPEDGLSGLACALLQQLVDNPRTRPMPVEQLLQLPGAAHVLETEHPEMILAWLEKHDGIPASQTLPLKLLLNIHKEVDYAL